MITPNSDMTDTPPTHPTGSSAGAEAIAMREIIAVATAIMRDALKGDLVTNQMMGFVKRYGGFPSPYDATMKNK